MHGEAQGGTGVCEGDVTRLRKGAPGRCSKEGEVVQWFLNSLQGAREEELGKMCAKGRHTPVTCNLHCQLPH